MAQTKKAAIQFIFFTLLIDITGFGLIIPVFPTLIKQLLHTNISVASEWGAWLTAVYAVMQFIFAPIIGNLSDRYGRRPVLLFSLLGFGIDYLFLSFAPTIWWLFVGRLIAGITGASFTTATAYIADISTDENRTKNFGMVGAAFGLGFIIGPLMGGLLGSIGPRVPFLAAAGLTLVNVAYGYFVLPESLSMENRRKFEWKRANPIGSLMHLRKYSGVAALVTSLVFIYIAVHSVQSTWTYINIEKFHWSETLIGVSLAIVGLLVAIVQGGLIRFVNPWLGNKKSIYLGLSLYTLGLVLFAFATQTWMMFLFLVPYCLGGIAGPALQAVISSHVPANEQGELQGSLTSLMSATSIIGPLLMNNLFAWFTRPDAKVHFAGAPFLAGAFLMFVSTLFSVRAMSKEANAMH
ncbi:MFS transporter [Pedobacter sp. HMF7647]|uniref:MFS transporter n=1 Tax=Hufsiella arboris TaxID=2695275 RepID=A0A7K1Y800_9SPHI|nr:TCR/Tet family MFS transporter [Hufsiella arboris]MXV50696.1 MFS transporter [Hufsiella arboris]